MEKKSLVAFAVSLVLLILIIMFVDLRQISEKIIGFGIVPFLFVNVLFSITYILHGIKWKLIVGKFKKISAKDATLILIIGYFANNFFPARIGEVVRALVLSKKTGLGKGISFSTVLVHRLTDVLSLLALFFVGIFFTSLVPAQITVGGIILLAFFSFVFFSIYASKKIFAVAKPLFIRLPEKVKKLLRDLAIGIDSLKGANGIAVWGLSFLLWIAHIPLYYYVLSFLGVKLGIVELLIVLAIVGFSSLIPSAPGYIGTLEAASVFALQIFGVDVNTAVSFGIISHLVIYFSTTILGLIALNALSLGFSDLRIKK